MTGRGKTGGRIVNLTVDRIERRECAHRDLWRAVLAMAVRDCFRHPRSSEKRNAMVWLFSDKDEIDRNTVCDFAGINFDAWRDDLLAIISRMEGEKYYMGHRKAFVGKYVGKMLVMHGS